MSISDEAVEAAALALNWHNTRCTVPTSSFLVEARIALEAAAPYMLGPLVADLDKWAGRSKSGFYDEAQDDVVQILKPYRSKA